MNDIEVNHQPELSPAQRAYWLTRLEDAERAVQVALRMLGRLSVEEDRTETGE